jgi:hypothetical protein
MDMKYVKPLEIRAFKKGFAVFVGFMSGVTIYPCTDLISTVATNGISSAGIGVHFHARVCSLPIMRE